MISLSRSLPGLFVLVGLWYCTPTPSAQQAAEAPVKETPPDWVALGDSLTIERQRVILQTLLKTAEREGWGGAVRYCHSAAETLTTFQSGSLSIQRVAQRNRNPKNALKDSLDYVAFAYFDSTGSKESRIYTVGQTVRYYRPIYIPMEACLKCHGEKEQLDAQALTEIRKRYPGDKAIGFKIGDLRGMWRMEVNTAGL